MMMITIYVQSRNINVLTKVILAGILQSEMRRTEWPGSDIEIRAQGFFVPQVLLQRRCPREQKSLPEF